MKSSRPPELANFFEVFKLSLQNIGNANILGAKSCLCSYYPKPLKRNGLLFCGENETTLVPFKATSIEGDRKASKNSTFTESDGCRQSNCSILARQDFGSNAPFTSVDPTTAQMTTNLTPSKTSQPLIIGLGVSILFLLILIMILIHFRQVKTFHQAIYNVKNSTTQMLYFKCIFVMSPHLANNFILLVHYYTHSNSFYYDNINVNPRNKIMKSVKDRKREEQTYATKKQDATINNQLSKVGIKLIKKIKISQKLT